MITECGKINFKKQMYSHQPNVFGCQVKFLVHLDDENGFYRSFKNDRRSLIP